MRTLAERERGKDGQKFFSEKQIGELRESMGLSLDDLKELRKKDAYLVYKYGNSLEED